MKKIHIFDIDNTICENIFPNLGEKSSIPEVKTKILQINLSPGFIKYFTKITKVADNEFFFLTGRKKVDFYEETIIQLKPLKINTDKIIFYPNTYPYTKLRYGVFKIFNILSISMKNKGSDITIYDDIVDYVPRLLEFCLKLNINKLKVEKVMDPFKFWNLKLRCRLF